MKLCFDILLLLSKNSHLTRQYQGNCLHFLVIHLHAVLKAGKWANLIVYIHQYLLQASLSNLLCIWSVTISTPSQLMLSSSEEVIPVKRDCNASILGLKGFWVSNHKIIFSIDFIWRCWQLDVNLTCCSLVLNFMFIRVVMTSNEFQRLHILSTHTSLAESIIPPPLVMLPLAFRVRHYQLLYYDHYLTRYHDLFP